MAVMTVGHLLDVADAFEKRLELYYADLRDRSTNDGVKLLTYHLARRKHRLPQALESYTAQQIENVRKIPIKFDDAEYQPAKCIEGRKLPDDATADALLDVAIDVTGCLAALYRRAAELGIGGTADQILLSLRKIEERDIVELKKTKATHYF